MASIVEKLKRTEHPAVRHLLLRGRGTMHAAVRGHRVRRRAVAQYLATTQEPALQIGSGPKRIQGWLNSDLISGDIHLDLEARLPFDDDTLAYVFGEHVIGSLSESGGQALMEELFRVLRPGGVLRLTTPDLRKLIAIYLDDNPEVSLADYSRYLDAETGKPHPRGCQVFNDAVRLWGIRFTYDADDLVAKLSEIGFAPVAVVEPGASEHPKLRALEQHGEQWVNRAEAVCVEATKPVAG
jgi:predicted SAM-dependent methyltransferase